ncbi:response regulator [Galbibacter sp.]|uniref:helix-turn-helix and ligand-binding sensor domain-containing protein n=1 Tax=Galbibacter sp. TaxID=2918471 RepID=UPI003A8D19BE
MRVRRCNLIFFLAFVWLCVGVAMGQNRPPIHNFDLNDYKAGIQNWGIAYGENHVFVANNEGLLEFDGVQWRFYQLPNQTIIRSVAYFDGKVYTGSYEEFGYWERQPTGTLEYHSLSALIDPFSYETESIWGIYQWNDHIVFKSFSSLFIYKDGAIKIIKPEMTLLGANVIEDSFYIFARNHGIYRLKDTELQLIKGTELLKDFKVQSMVALSDKQLLIGTSLNGMFIWDGSDRIVKWQHPLNEVAKQHQLNKVSINESYIFLGTIKNGLYVLNRNTGQYYNINVHSGLQNNTILGSLVNDRGIVWLSLDNGISAIPMHFNAYYLNPSNYDIGGVYDMVNYKGETYIATNTGMYVSNKQGIHFLEGSQGHIWDLTLVDGLIICGHNLGTYQIKDGRWELISSNNGGYDFKPVERLQNTYIQGNYTGLALYAKQGDTWEVNEIEGLGFPVKKIVFEKDYIAWVAHPYKGIYRIHFSDDYKKVTKIEKDYNEFFENSYAIKLFEIEGQIAFYNNQKWFVFNSLEENIVSFNSLTKILKNDQHAYPITDSNSSPVVFKKEDGGLFVRKHLTDEDSQFYIPNRYYGGHLIKGEERAVVVNDSVVQIALYNDILVVKNQKITGGSLSFMPKINRILKNGIPQVIDSLIRIKQRDSLSIEVSTPFLSNNTMVYSIGTNHSNYRKVEDGRIFITNQNFGRIPISIQSIVKGRLSNKATVLTVEVEKPWFLGVWGAVLLILLLLLLSIFILTINKYVLIRHKKYLEVQFEHQNQLNRKEEALRHEKKLNEIQKNQHQQALKNKTKELANTAMELTKKNEMLMKLKEELNYFKSEIIDKSRYNKLLGRIDKHLKDSKDWELFESNFNEIHDSFFRELHKLHPEKLTPKDLKLCAYLKMNLSSKEIAPLMGISIRGVEIHRYRLRKKLELSTDQNMNEYLTNI